MKHKKILKITSLLALILIVVVPVLDTYVLKSDGFGLTFGVAAILILIVLPAAMIITTLYGTGKIIRNLTSKEVPASQKTGTLRRLLNVIAIIVGIFIFFNVLIPLVTN